MFNGLRRKEELPPAIATKNPGDFDLGSIESRVAARALAERQKDQGIRIAVYTIGTNRPADEPKPKHRFRDGFMEMYYQDDDDYETSRQNSTQQFRPVVTPSIPRTAE